MPFIRIELDAMDKFPMVAAAAGISTEKADSGFMRLWRYCWKEKTDQVQPIHLGALFGGDGELVAKALVAFGFLEPLPGGADYRVRGSETYLRISSAKAKAGAARAQEAGRSSGRFTSTPPADHQQPTSTPPAADQLSHRSPITDHRSPKQQQAPAAPSRTADDPYPLENALAFFGWRQEARLGRFPQALEEPPPPNAEAWWLEFAAAVRERGPPLDVGRETYRAFLADPWVETLKPPGAWEAFAKRWRKYVPGQDAGPGPPLRRLKVVQKQ